MSGARRVLGGGAWGTALACRCAARRPRCPAVGARCRRPSRRSAQRRAIRATCRASRFDAGIGATTDLAEALDGADCVLAVTPGAGAARSVLAAQPASLPPGVPLVLCAKGIEQRHRLLLSADRRRELCPAIRSPRSPARASPPMSRAACRPPWSSRRSDEALAGRSRAALLDRAFPLLFDRRSGRRRDRRRAEERPCHRRRRRRRRRARRQRAGRAGHARLRRTAAHRRRRFGARAGNADGPVRPRRPAADLRARAQSRNFAYGLALGRRREPGGPAAGRRRRDRRHRRAHRRASAASTRRSSPPWR